MYKIKDIIYNKLFENHIPYLLGLLIEGPRGGLYFLDAFNSEMLLNKMYNSNLPANFLVDNLIKDSNNTLKITKIKVEYTNEKELNDIIKKKYNCKVLIRKDGMEKTLAIANKISVK